jgi:hypothetical protein
MNGRAGFFKFTIFYKEHFNGKANNGKAEKYNRDQ